MIRQAGPGDLEAIARLERECFAEPWNERLIESDLRGANRLDLVVTDEDEIVGYVLAMRIVDELHVNKIGVDKRARRRGIARELMRVLEALALEQGCKKVALEVRASNTGARDFYIALGFSIEYVRRRYYANREDAIFMSRKLKAER